MGSRSVNSVTLLGCLGRDAETKHTPGGTAVTTFSIATNRRWRDKTSGEWREEVDWASCVLWDSEALAAYLKKSKQIYVEGRLQTRSWEKDGVKYYRTEVVVSEVILLGGKDGDSRPAAPAPAPRSAPSHDDPWADDNVAF